MKQGQVGSPQDRGRKARMSMTSFDDFYKAYVLRLTRVLVARASDTNFAEDAVTTAFMAVYNNWEMLVTYDRPDSWLFKVAINRLHRLEAKARDLCMLREDIASVENDLRLASIDDPWIDDRLDLIAAIRSLPRRQIEVISLHFFADCTLSEVASILHIQEGSVKQHLYRALKNLGNQLGPQGTTQLTRRIPA